MWRLQFHLVYGRHHDHYCCYQQSDRHVGYRSTGSGVDTRCVGCVRTPWEENAWFLNDYVPDRVQAIRGDQKRHVVRSCTFFVRRITANNLRKSLVNTAGKEIEGQQHVWIKKSAYQRGERTQLCTPCRKFLTTPLSTGDNIQAILGPVGPVAVNCAVDESCLSLSAKRRGFLS